MKEHFIYNQDKAEIEAVTQKAVLEQTKRDRERKVNMEALKEFVRDCREKMKERETGINKRMIVKMNKKGQLQILSNPKTIAYTIGGAIIANFIFNSIEATIIGGLIGLAISFVR